MAIVRSVRWYWYALRREDGHILRMALDFEVEGQKKKGRPKKTWRTGRGTKCESWFEKRRCNSLNKVEC